MSPIPFFLKMREKWLWRVLPNHEHLNPMAFGIRLIILHWGIRVLNLDISKK